jgi:predicted ArsR family transcriptional regulator
MSRDTSGARSGDALTAVTSLAENTRRALYEFVAGEGGWVSRDQAADGISIERGAASHHLDRLALDGLLQVDYQRLTGRQGPGAGRTAKLYRRSDRDFDVSLPQRDYQLAARLLAEGVDQSRHEGIDISVALERVAHAEGRRIGGEIADRLGNRSRAPMAERRKAVVETLSEHGFEPREEGDGTVVLRNCPFHQLAKLHTDLICGMNLCLVSAAVEGTKLTARLEPEDGLCCVKRCAT